MDNEEEAIIMNNLEEAKSILKNKNSLCFEGGGVLGIAEVGALVRLQQLGGLAEINNVVGTSVGSILAAGLGCGASIDFIKNTMFGINLKNFQDSSCFLINIIRFFRKGGWYKGDEIENFMGRILKILTGNENITLLDAFNRFKIRTTIVYFSVNYGKTIYADYKTKPNLKIKEAVRRSSAIPAYFGSVWEDRPGKSKNVIVDGGIADNYPLHVLKDQQCSPKCILGLKLCSPNEYNEYKEDAGEEIEEIDQGPPGNIYEHFTRLLGFLHNQALRYHVEDDDWKLTVKIDIGKYQTTDFDISNESLLWLFNQGVMAVDKHVLEIKKMLDEGTYP